jgi:hypothetical protein
VVAITAARHARIKKRLIGQGKRFLQVTKLASRRNRDQDAVVFNLIVVPSMAERSAPTKTAATSR